MRSAGLATLDIILAMIVWLRHFLSWLRSAFCAREDLVLENLALRQQLLALHVKRPRRRLTASHKRFWVVLRRLSLVKTSYALNSFRISNIQEQKLGCVGQDVTMLHVGPEGSA